MFSAKLRKSRVFDSLGERRLWRRHKRSTGLRNISGD